MSSVGDNCSEQFLELNLQDSPGIIDFVIFSDNNDVEKHKLTAPCDRDLRLQRRDLLGRISALSTQLGRLNSRREVLTFKETLVKALDWDVRNFSQLMRSPEKNPNDPVEKDREAEEFKSLVTKCKTVAENLLEISLSTCRPPDNELGKIPSCALHAVADTLL